MYFAYIKDGIVEQVGDSDNLTFESTSVIDEIIGTHNRMVLGSIWDGEAFVAPAIQPDNEEKQTNNDFRSLLTMREKKLMNGSVEDQIKALNIKIERKL